MKAWRELARLPRRMWVLAAATLVNRAGTMALPFLPLYLTRSLGFTPGQAGAILALYGAVSFVTAPLSGRLCDRWGTQRLMIASMAASGLAMLVFPLARGLPAVVAMTVVWGVATEAFRPAGMTAVAESAPPELRKQAYALHRLAINLGMSVGPALGGFLAGFSFPALWAVDGITSIAAAGVLALAGSAAAAPAAADAPPSVRGLSDSRLRYCLLAFVPVAVVFFQHEGAMPIFLVRDLGFSEVFYGLQFTLNTLMIVALEVPLNHATAHWPARRSLALGSLLFAAGFGALAFARTPWEVSATTVVWTFGEMILLPAMSAYVSDIAPAARRGEYMGLYMMSFSVAFMVGPWAGLFALQHWGPAVLWGCVFLAGALSAALLSAVAD